jgi:hypothetical protein
MNNTIGYSKMDKRSFAMLTLLLGGTTLASGCAWQQGAIRKDPIERRNYTLVQKSEEGDPKAFDDSIDAATLVAYGKVQPQLHSIDGPDTAPSDLDSMVTDMRMGKGMYPKMVSFGAETAADDQLFRDVSSTNMQKILEEGVVDEFFGGAGLYLPQTAKVAEDKVHMQVAHVPKSKGRISGARFMGAKGTLEQFLAGRSFDRVREFDIYQRGGLFKDKRKVLHIDFYALAGKPEIV